ncbi:ABC transporter ATP-binding protein [Yinghuangia soli]|uniref:ATP-binding cassette domain-containing protein n=1 Tax=Yinghuangia soli TaxID=2908204 RepID=A0AA41Q6C5_9ACTN|nr:ATP-binding cassette domain-containing protein [Yinghuangia soli]MCF2531800.1 ATP-binding cassette domain-containing protein [Yinghuangia soli]
MSETSGRTVLDAADICVSFGGVRAVDHVSVSVAEGQVVGVIGPNGSGKTTLLNALSGVVPASGRLAVEGHRVRLGGPERSRRAGLVRMFQQPQPYRFLTCQENVLIATPDRRARGLGSAWLLRPRMLHIERARWAASLAALDRVGLAAKAQVPAAILTYGEQRLLDVARGISAEPRVLMLDEPSAGLNDTETAQLLVLLRSVAADGVALLVIDHKIDFIDALCDRITVLETGQVVAEGPPAHVWQDRRVMDAYLGTAHDA